MVFSIALIFLETCQKCYTYTYSENTEIILRARVLELEGSQSNYFRAFLKNYET